MVIAWELLSGERFPQHDHPVHQLTLTSATAVAMVVADRTWVIPPSRALWVPAGTSHSIEPVGAGQVTTLWFDPARCPIRWAGPVVVPVDVMVEALVGRLRDPSLEPAARTRSERVLFDVLEPLPADELDLTLPADDRARRVAEALLLDPSDRRTLAAWGAAVGASERTLMRAFRSGTGLGFHEWRNRARVAAALRLLLTDAPIAAIAPAVGYSTTSAFCAAFRRTMGAPASHFRR